MKDTKIQQSRKKNPEQLRLALIQAASQLFNERGYFGVNSNEIAIHAGYSAGSFYTQFPNKLELFECVYDNWLTQEWDQIASLIDLDLSIENIIASLVEALKTQHQQWKGLRLCIAALSATEPQIRLHYLLSKRLQIENIKQLAQYKSLQIPEDAHCLSALCALEKLLDWYAHGLLPDVGLTLEQVTHEMNRLIAGLFQPHTNDQNSCTNNFR
jgi:AcrR family transcriptional regulator